MATEQPLNAQTEKRPSAAASDTLLEVTNLKTHFHTDDGIVRAVDGVDLKVRKGRTLGIVGESGCGKSVLARSIMRLNPEPPAVMDGQIMWQRQDGETIDLAAGSAKSKQLRDVRGKEIAMVFQEPMTSLSPVHTVGNQIVEALKMHEEIEKEEGYKRAAEMLAAVGIGRADEIVHTFPFQLSGGMRQRVMIAMAMICHPSLLIADEPTTALDVTVEAGILRLMGSLQKQMGMSIMIITHDLGVVAKIADDVVVMYMGKVVEQGDVNTIFEDPQHPYTQALLRSMPRLGHGTERLESIRGSVPDPYSIPVGCSFFPRCREAQAGKCDIEVPPLIEVGGDHLARCVMRGGEKRG